MISRRQFIQSSLSMGVCGLAGHRALAAPTPPARTLLLIELTGGNDSLNSVIPFRDPLYYKLRPNIAIDADQVLPVSDKLGLNPRMDALMPLWRSGELGIVQGVGYPSPNRSHFRSIEIWQTGSNSAEILSEGWVSRSLPNSATTKHAPKRVADSVSLGKSSNAPFTGGSLNALVIKRPDAFLKDAESARSAALAATSNPALAHLMRVQSELNESRRALAELLPEERYGNYRSNQIGRALADASRLIATGHAPHVIHVSHGSFDTHALQRSKQDALLESLSTALATFVAEMKALGRWNEVLIMTYSEFGRRVSENGSKGTDHGTAASHLILGGRVKGRLYGQQPSLANLANGDLIHNVDFRQLYAEIARDWWGASASPFDKRHTPLGFLHSL